MARSSPAVKHFLQCSLASNTQKAYEQDLRRFKAQGGAIPSTPEFVARYLAKAASTLKPSTLARQLAAITYAHERQGLPSPAKAPIVRRTLRGIRRTYGTAQKQAKPLSPELVRQVSAPLDCRSRAQNDRDAALLRLAFAGGFRRSEISALRVGDVELSTQGMLIKLRRSKTDQYHRGRDVAIPAAKDNRQCAVKAVRKWLRTLEVLRGSLDPAASLFCSIDRHGNARSAPLNSASIGWLLRRRFALNSLEATGYTAHSFRAGLVTSAAKAGVPIWAIQRQTGHRSESTVHRYIRGLSAFECNALTSIL